VALIDRQQDYKERLERLAAEKKLNGSRKHASSLTNGQDLIRKVTEAEVLSDIGGDSAHIPKTFNNLLRSQSMPYVEQETNPTETDIKA